MHVHETSSFRPRPYTFTLQPAVDENGHLPPGHLSPNNVTNSLTLKVCCGLVTVLDLRLKRSWELPIPAVAFSGKNFGQVVYTPVPLSASSIIWHRSSSRVPGGWEGNRRSGVALAMRHRLEEVYPRAHGLTKETSTVATHLLYSSRNTAQLPLPYP